MDDYVYEDSDEEEYVYEDSSDEDDTMGDSPTESLKHMASSSGAGPRAERLSSGAEEFRVLSGEQLAERMEEVVKQLEEITCLRYDDALSILRHYKWNSNRAQTEWFDDQNRVRDIVGIPVAKVLTGSGRSDILGKRGRMHSNPQVGPPTDAAASSLRQTSGSSSFFSCPICMTDYSPKECFSLACGHMFCKECMSQYVTVAISGGPACTVLACPENKCNSKVTSDIVHAVCPRLAPKWYSFMLRSFVDHNRSARWCPQKNCDNAVEYRGGGVIDVTCNCGLTFCFGCSRETHRPATCADVERWHVKNCNESENLTWIMANTKPCPKCGVNIEKNQGCNHMTCRQSHGGCGHEFCWLCLGDWSKHGQATGGYYACNKYEKEKLSNKSLKRLEKKKADAKHELQRYMHFFERYDSHAKSRKFVEKTRRIIQSKRETLHDCKGYRIGETQFLLQAADQIHDARRVLQWTYVYGYYLQDTSSRDLFEHLQENLEKFTEQLHELVERDLSPFVDVYKDTTKEFMEHRLRITNLMASTAQYRANLLEGIEAGLQNVGLQGAHK